MNRSLFLIFSGFIFSGCDSGGFIVQPAIPAGFADGSKTINTKNLIFDSTSKSYSSLYGLYSNSDTSVRFRTTHDPNKIILIHKDENDADVFTTLNFRSSKGEFRNVSGFQEFILRPVSSSSNKQVGLYLFEDNFESILPFPVFSSEVGYAAIGLLTDPATMAGKTGTATFVGPASIDVIHSDLGTGFGTGTATMTADFGAGSISGTMSITDAGNSTAGLELSPTIITVDPTSIDENGFDSTLTFSPTDLGMIAQIGSSISGNFFGVDATNIGASFNGAGLSGDGQTPVVFIGGLIGQ